MGAGRTEGIVNPDDSTDHLALQEPDGKTLYLENFSRPGLRYTHLAREHLKALLVSTPEREGKLPVEGKDGRQRRDFSHAGENDADAIAMAP